MASFTAALKQWVIDTYQTKMGADDNYVTDAEKAALHSHANKTALDAVSGTNTGDQDLSGYSLTTHDHAGVYAPVSHTHAASQISDSTDTGRALITAATATAARAAISAAPALGNDDNYVTDAEKAALHTHPAVIAQGATAADARAAIGAGTSNLAIGTTAGTAKEGNYAPPNASTTVAGIVELATTTETTTGTDTTRATTPAGVKAALDAKAASDMSTYAAPTGTDDRLQVNGVDVEPEQVGAAPALGADDNYLTDAEKLALHTHPAVIAQGATQADARAAIGLGSAATTASTDYATAAQGSTADAAIPKSTVTARGDLLTATAASTPERLGVGTGGQTIVADPSTATGLAWEHRAPRVGLYLPDVSGNYVSTPDSAALDITGDIDIAWHGALDTWTGTAATQILVSKFLTAGNQRSYYLGITATGLVTIAYSPDGAATTSRSSTIETGLAPGQESWVRATLDVDNGAGGQSASFYTSVDGVTWTRLGATVTVAVTGVIFPSTAPLEINGTGAAASNRAAGVHMGARVCSIIGGAPAASWDGRVSHTRQRGPGGEIWTVNGTANAWQVMR